MEPPARPPEWVRHVVWWQVYPLGFVGAEDQADDGPVRHRLGRIANWLDHLIVLGANGLLLGPVFASMSHGYDTLDHFTVDSRLGDGDDLDGLLRVAAERGIRVLFDGVFNHVGSAHPRVAELGRRAADGGWSSFEGHTQLVELDHESDAVADLVVEVMNHWLDRGIDGWRLDAAYALPPEFWARVLPRVRERHPDAWFVAELIHGDGADFVARSGVDSVTAYELWKAIWSSLRDRNLWELDWTLRRHAQLVESFLPLTFVGNHDVSRIASQIPDPALRSHAVALLLFLPGVPSLYYGDEYGLEGVKEERLGGDAAIRPAMPDRPEALSDHPMLGVHRELIAVRRRHPWLADAVISTAELTNTTLEITAAARRDPAVRLVLALNLASEPRPVPAGDVLAGAGVDGQLPPASWAVVRPD
jgi:cyclomaltodextrinase